MRKQFLSFLVLFFSACLFLACSNLLNADKKSSEINGLSLTLPYGKAKESSSRGADSASRTIAYSFEITFKHESGTETVMKGRSGETVTFENAPAGKYEITVYGLSDDCSERYEGKSSAEVVNGAASKVRIKLTRTDCIEINLLSYTDEMEFMIQSYIKTHPESKIVLNSKIVSTTYGEYQPYLNEVLENPDGDYVPDIYVAEAAFVLGYSKGAFSKYALPFENLGIDIDEKIKEAEIAQYSVDMGTTEDGKVVALGYQTTGGAFIYRRSLAKQVFGTDNPERISEAIGGTTGSWDKFLEAAATCKEKGISIVSGDGDLWHPVENSAEKGWVDDNKLVIDEKREAFFDLSKSLTYNGWSNGTQDWTDEWYVDMSGTGTNPVLGFFGPAWLINFVIEPKSGDTWGDWAICMPPVGFSWGGSWIFVNQIVDSLSQEKKEAVRELVEWLTLDTSEDGLLYKWANGTLSGEKGVQDTVSSKVVMEKSNGRTDFLGGQNMFDIYTRADALANGKNQTEYDDQINRLFREEVRKYAAGDITKEVAVNNFKYAVKSETGLDVGEVSDIFVTDHITAEPDEHGIKFTVSAKEGENWKLDSSRIVEKESGMFIRLNENLPVPGEPVECYWPFTESGKSYRFVCELKVNENDDEEPIIEEVCVAANVNGESVSVNLDALKNLKPVLNLDDGTVKLSMDVGQEISCSENVTPYFDFGAFTTEADKYTWSQWLNSAYPELGETAISPDGKKGYPLLEFREDNKEKLKEDGACFVDLNIEFRVEGLNDIYRCGTSFKSDIYDVKDMSSVWQ